MHWYTFFFVTRSERRGIFSLLIFIGVLLLIRIVLAQAVTAKNAQFTETNQPLPAKVKVVKTNRNVELNSADTTLLKQLRGIGSGYARMIVNYREKLGGFYHKEQLLEVYRFPRETFEKIEAQLQVDTTLIRKLPINHLSLDELKRHPYIRYFQAKSICEYRQKKPSKRYNSTRDLVLDEDVTPDFIDKIRPYLSFE